MVPDLGAAKSVDSPPQAAPLPGAVSPVQAPQRHIPSILQVVFSLVAVSLLMFGAVLYAAAGLVSLFTPSRRGGIDPASATQVFLLAAGLFMASLLVLPSAWYAFVRLLGHPVHFPEPVTRTGQFIHRYLLHPLALLILWPLLLLVGEAISKNPSISWFLLPPIHVLAVGLPILWLVMIGKRGLPVGSPQRAWGVFGAGLALGPAIILVAELSLLVAAFVLVGIYVSFRPDLSRDLRLLINSLQRVGNDPEAVLTMVEPYLKQPLVIVGVIGFMGVLVPVVEELFKPIGVWFLAGRALTPAEGFTAGLLSGAAYALFENLAYTAMSGDWLELVLTRSGSSVLHMLTAAITGWGLVQAWRYGRYLLLALCFFIAMLFHGFWNSSAVLSGVLMVSQNNPGGLNETLINNITTGLLVAVIVILFCILLAFNWALRRSQRN